MTSEVDIANRALDKVGDSPIVSFSDDNKRARAVNRIYEFVRDSELSLHTWRFAQERVTLAPSATAPAFGWDARYQLPSDWLETVRVEASNGVLLSANDYEHEGQYIMTNESTSLNLIYIYRVTDTTKFHMSFVEALACKLAIELCEPLTQSNTKIARLISQYDMAIDKARAVNAISQPPRDLVESTFISARI